MYLKIADKLVKQGDFAGALQAIARAKEIDPGNRYAIAYEARVLELLKNPPAPAAAEDTPPPAQNKTTPVPAAPVGTDGFPTTEKQLRNIATPLMRSGSKLNPRDPKDAAILSKVASLLTSANEYLAQQRYSQALETIGRAMLLDPSNRDIRVIEERIRSAQDEARRRAFQRAQEREWNDKILRDKIVQDEVERLRQEREAKRQSEESERKRAQELKIAQSFQRTRAFLDAGQLDEAQCELAFVTVLSPAAPEVTELEVELSRRRDERQRAQEEEERRRLEEERRREQQLRDEIQRSVREAETLASQGNFTDALRVLTEAYLLDPTNSAVETCERTIVAAQRAAAEREEEERKQREEEARRAMEAAEQVRQAEERERLLQLERAAEVAEKTRAAETIRMHIAAAREYLASTQFKEALAEVALAYVVDPLHPDVKEMEAEITSLMSRPSPRSIKPPAPEPITLPSAERAETVITPEMEEEIEYIARLLTEAKQLAAQHRHLPALHAATRALERDPGNISAKKLVASLKEELEKFQKEVRRSSDLRRGSQTLAAPEPKFEHMDHAGRWGSDGYAASRREEYSLIRPTLKRKVLLSLAAAGALAAAFYVSSTMQPTPPPQLVPKAKQTETRSEVPSTIGKPEKGPARKFQEKTTPDPSRSGQIGRLSFQ